MIIYGVFNLSKRKQSDGSFIVGDECCQYFDIDLNKVIQSAEYLRHIQSAFDRSRSEVSVRGFDCGDISEFNLDYENIYYARCIEGTIQDPVFYQVID